jgi:hypothetical protein
MDSLGFEFDSAEVIDRDPAPPGSSRVMQAGAGDFLSIADAASANLVRTA